jgi:hypothetical protein
MKPFKIPCAALTLTRSCLIALVNGLLLVWLSEFGRTATLPTENTWVLTVTGEMGSPQGLVRRSTAVFEFCQRNSAVQGIRRDDFSEFGKQGVAQVVAPTVRDSVERLAVHVDGQVFHFRQSWPASEIQLTFQAGNTTFSIAPPPLKFPLGEYNFDLPIKDGASTDWDGGHALPKNIWISYHYVVKKKPVTGQRTPDRELLDVPITKQTGNNCWAAVPTMMINWKEKRSLGIGDMLSRVSPKYKKLFDDDKRGIYDDEMEDLSKQLGMKTEGPRSYSVEELLGLLSTSGPIEFLMSLEPKTQDLHVILLVGISGDGTPCGTHVGYIDPAAGKLIESSFANLLETLAAEDLFKKNYNVRAVHF